jgi:hypothetical protein
MSVFHAAWSIHRCGQDIENREELVPDLAVSYDCGEVLDVTSIG